MLNHKESGIKLQNLEAVLIDLDETIFEFRLSSRDGLEQMKKGVESLSNIDAFTLEDQLWNLERKNLPFVLEGTMRPRDYRKERLRMLSMLHGYTPSENELETMESQYTKAFEKNMRLCPGALDFLRACRRYNVPVAIITNGDYQTQLRTVKKLHIEKMIDMLLTPANRREMKPSPTLFERAVDKFGIMKSKTIMIGDSWIHDVDGAMNSQIQPVWVNRRNEVVPRNVGVVEIKSMKELI
ncbi:MAG: HAD-IA family hydrolase [Candidatus Parvarchaeota archaeon]